ncbi:hypothetical protein BH11ACT8_BH11ACT8_16260 [soil metagenome]
MIGVPAGTRSQIRRVRRRGAGVVREGFEVGAARLRRVPLPQTVRDHVATPLIWESGTTEVPVHQLLLGGQNGLRGNEYAIATDDVMWTSRRVSEGPHADLLRADRSGRLCDQEVLDSDYATMARRSIAASGSYFGARDDAGILRVARAFLEPGEMADRDPAMSAAGSPVLAAPIQGSSCYQVVDGHHRVARLAVDGESFVQVRLRRRAVSTRLQDLLDQMSWIGGERELYQPVEAPELEESWATVRRCSDRFDLMSTQLAELGVAGATYLDVASCYGWFLAAMAGAGHDVHGVERDPLGRTLGGQVYGLDPERVTTGDAVAFLLGQTVRYDVVSCFSLLHHFALGRASVPADVLVRLLDQSTGRVLFIDTGQAHEEWFADSLPEWDTDYVADFLRKHSTFDRIVDLGPDQDAVPPYAGNYARHLFACIRDV